MASSDATSRAQARRRIKRATGLLREATRELAAAEPLAVVPLERGADTARVGEVLHAMLERHGALELCINRAPAEPAPTTAPTGREGDSTE